MAVTITQADASIAIRAVTDADNAPLAITLVLDSLFPAAVDMVLRHAGEAPDSIHNAAVIRLLGWLWDSDPALQSSRQGIVASGAAALLAQWRNHRAGSLPVASDTPGDTPSGGDAELPSQPGTGTFILTTQNGVLEWVEFPLPS